jgi:hypothetical protein
LEQRPRSGFQAWSGVVRERDAVRAKLSPADYRYLEFQLWQEGVARFVEYAVARAATRWGKPSVEFQALPDYQSYRAVASRIRHSLPRELARLSLGRDRRVGFYSLGAASALLLEESGSDWKRSYFERPFTLTPLLSGVPTSTK